MENLVKEGVPIHLLTADLGFKLMDHYREQYPNRFTNVGVSEGNMIGVAAGMAAAGLRPFCYSMVPFVFMRAFEQVRSDLCVNDLPVTLLGVGGGLSYGCEGPSHFAIEDLGMARSLPNLRVIAPGDPHEVRLAVKKAATADGPTYIRIAKNNDPFVHQTAPDSIDLPIKVDFGGGSSTGDSSRLEKAKPSVVVFATGHVLSTTREAVEKVIDTGLSIELFSLPTFKPFPEYAVSEITHSKHLVMTVEEHNVLGGLGSAVADTLISTGFRGKFAKIGLPDRYPEEIGGHQHLRDVYGLTPEAIAERILKEHSAIAASPV